MRKRAVSVVRGSPLEVMTRVERKHPALPRFVLVPNRSVAPWLLDRTTVVELTVNGVETGRRTLKRGDEENWYMDLPEPICRRVGIETGDPVKLVLRLASEALPEELSRVLATDLAARARWERLTQSQQRMVREHVQAAKQAATRERRAACALGRGKRLGRHAAQHAVGADR
jgi:hypothetical protein